MFQPITLAPMFSRASSTIRALSFTSPPCLSWASRQAASGTTQSWSRSPPSPSGFSSLWFGPATKPSSEIEISHLSLLILPPQWAVAADAASFYMPIDPYVPKDPSGPRNAGVGPPVLWLLRMRLRGVEPPRPFGHGDL